MSILDNINKANDIKNIDPKDYKELALELRRFMLENVCKVGGHMASSLGVVELTMALHLFLDFPKDKLIWDVGHQSYAHKILSGRKEEFKTLRQFGGLSGFPKISESDCDAFDTGHSSTSISAAMGYVKARDLRGTDEKVVAVIGDGALSGGMAFEALNNAGRLKSNLIIVLNDNKMSISENVGGMANYLGNLRTNPAYNKLKQNVVTALNAIPERGEHVASAIKRTKASIKQLLIDGMFFEDMNITYIGPINGYNIEQMRYALELAARKDNACLVHVVTKKGRGYKAAEQNPVKFHGIGPFDRKTGEAKKKAGKSFTEHFAGTITELAKQDEKICAITAAMMPGTGLTSFAEQFPDRFFDVGIAEEHAVTFAAGLAAAGFKPVFAVYSTFLQRGYDQVVHDVCLEKLPVVFAVDRNGIVGHDGETHQGIYTHSFLGHIPGLTVLEPKDGKELQAMIKYAFTLNAPVAVCYPRRQVDESFDEFPETPVETGKAEVLCEGDGEVMIFGAGPEMWSANEAVNILKQQGINAGLVNLRFVTPMDEETIKAKAKGKKLIVSVEENVKRGGTGEMIASILCENNVKYGKFLNLALPDEPLKQGKISELKAAVGIDGQGIANAVLKAMKKGK